MVAKNSDLTLSLAQQKAEDLVYMRLSVVPFNTIMEYLNLTSALFVLPIFETSLLTALNKIHDNENQHTVECYEVRRYYLIWQFSQFSYVVISIL